MAIHYEPISAEQADSHNFLGYVNSQSIMLPLPLPIAISSFSNMKWALWDK